MLAYLTLIQRQFSFRELSTSTINYILHYIIHYIYNVVMRNKNMQAKKFIGYDNSVPTSTISLSILIIAFVLFTNSFIIKPLWNDFTQSTEAQSQNQ